MKSFLKFVQDKQPNIDKASTTVDARGAGTGAGTIKRPILELLDDPLASKRPKLLWQSLAVPEII